MSDIKMELPADTAEETIQVVSVEGLSEFVPLLMDWHEKKVAIVQHLRTIPMGTEVQIENDQPFVLEGASHRAFQMGIELALEHLGDLPFVAEFEEEDTVH